MQLSNIFTFALAACGAVSAVPAPSPEAEAHAAAVEARAWPANGMTTSWGICHGSGRWGKRVDAITAINQFCAQHAKGQSLQVGYAYKLTGTYHTNGYKWDLEISRGTTNSQLLTLNECYTVMTLALDYCKGNNQDTRGGKGYVVSRGYDASIDPNDL
ncbi:hypothetical protein QBC40DRAFT_259526 [Triangularia verruculosa]|uniref:Uncharacterized protein n=1 Tax=Triangularia verruculosa TaxID=2587418 RepID=A0AAN6X8H0_9PEZI|nr:hypothetical protein QBC40DRAFT_259526 [Triangularia verruculosa]